MKTVQEGDLIFDVTSAVSYERFDDKKLHGSKSTMKKVDFIIENEDGYIFLEVKDPDDPVANNPQKFYSDFRTGNFIPEIAGQCRDTLLFTKLRQDTEKPIAFVVLVAMEGLEDALIIPKIDELIRALPLKNKTWGQASVDSCIILKLDAYKEKYGEE